MGLEAVKEEIIRNSKQQQESMIAEAKKKVVETMEETEKKVAEMKLQSDAATKQMMAVIKKQELASAELENKKALLEEKKQLIEAVFDQVEKKVKGLDSQKRENYINKLLEKAKNDIGVENVYCNEKDVNLVKDLNAETADIIGGLIAENKDKTVRVDYSFDTLLQNIKENELQSISKVLFG